MSGHRRPSPIQPPFLDSSTQDSMSRVAQQPMFPTPNFLGRPEHRPGAGPSLPPIQTVRDRQHESRTLPPIHLPPLQSAAGSGQKPLGISQLVSSPAPVRPPTQPYSVTVPSLIQPVQQPVPHQPVYTSLHTRVPYGGHPHDPRVQSAYAQAHPQGQIQGGQHQFDRPSPTGFRPPQQAQSAQQSPAVTSSTASRSYYGSEEPSPRTSVAPREFPSPTPQTCRPLPFVFHLSIRQQPAAARACGFGERDRRVIDPPPILELKVTDHDGRPEKDWDGMLAVACTLLGQSGEDETEVPPAHPHQAATRRLMGTLVASTYEAKDEHGVAGTFFVFPDLSCRSPGKFRLHFKLLRIDPERMTPGNNSPCVATITSDVFSVFTAKDFPGMRASSALLKSLRRQGLNVGVKKGSEARKTKGVKSKKEDSSSDEDSDSDGSADERRGSGTTRDSGSNGEVSPRTQHPRKKAKKRRRDS